ncbi:hypothetical protein BDN72DRAFT_953637 [Pluteus cervinus]|uniref:Uncharacterized protein n=1 Tax=Pluteus cervinus TaxID=181527 RepID=A0ACD3BHC7_9AGAR|nr:hypothetical protein BDN72DRAFT_953637 [Pluteus cervinus]
MRSFLWTSVSFLSLFSVARAFSFNNGPPSECDGLALTWTGGSGPYQLLLVPVFGTPRNVSIPPSAVSNGQGSYSIQLPFPANQKFLLVMSDSTGFGTGGTTDVLTVGPSQGGKCNTTDPGINFSFEANSALQQCRPFSFSAYTGAVQPISILAMVPGGTSLVLNPPLGSTDYSWTANAAEGTSMIFAMVDSQGRQGGSSDVRLVGVSDDTTCLSANSPSSTSARPSPTSTLPSSAPSKSATQSPAPSTGPAMGVIIGTAVGGFLFLAVLVTLGLFFLRKRYDVQKHTRLPPVDLTQDSDEHGFPGSGMHTSSSAMSTTFLIPMGGAQPQGYYDPRVAQPPSASAPQSQYAPTNYVPSVQPSRSEYSASSYVPSRQSVQPPPSEYSTSTYFPSSQVPISPFGYAGSSVSETTAYGQPPVANSVASDTLTSAQRKAQQAGVSNAYKPARFIVHTDLEDNYPPPPNEEEVVELPPQYTERRPDAGPSRAPAAFSSELAYR